MDSLDAAEPLVRQSVAMRRAMFGDGHIDVAFARTELADLLSRRGRLAEAESLFTQALIAREALVGPRHPAVASSLQDLGILAYARGDTAAGLLRFLRSAEIWREAKLSRPRWADALAAVRGARVAGRTALVDSLLEATAASDTANVHPITGARLLVLLGERLAARGDSAGAEGAWMRAHAWLRGLAAPAGTAERARIAARLAAFYAQRGRPAESAAWRERSAAP
jgi:tetratricopeptide (TPR) repeat protein